MWLPLISHWQVRFLRAFSHRPRVPRYRLSTAPDPGWQPTRVPARPPLLHSHPATPTPAHRSTNRRPVACGMRSWGNLDGYNRALPRRYTHFARRCSGTLNRSEKDCRSQHDRQECSSLRKSNSTAPILFHWDRNGTPAPSSHRKAATASIARHASEAARCDRRARTPSATTGAATGPSN